MISGSVERVSGTDPYSISVNFENMKVQWICLAGNTIKKMVGHFSSADLKMISYYMRSFICTLRKTYSTAKNRWKRLPDVVRSYVISVNSHKLMHDMPPYLHSYILGSLNDITFNTQVEIEKIIDIKSKMEH